MTAGTDVDAELDTARLEGVLSDRDAWTAERCSVSRAMGVVGTRSAMLLLREAFYGTRRFDAFARRVGITEAVAATRLRELVEAGLLAKRPYQEPGSRTRDEYRLTDAGRDLFPAVVALMQWGDAYLADPAGPPIQLRHRGSGETGCGEPVRAEVRCAAGHEVPPREVGVSVGRRRPTSAASPGSSTARR